MVIGRIPEPGTGIPESIIAAKGDLIVGTANDTPGILSVGNNGETLVADSSTTTGLRYQGTMAAGRNAVINGGFDIWQRGTTIALAANTAVYSTDRFMAYSVAAGRTVSRQLTNDSTNLPFIQYATRLQRDSGDSATDQIRFVMSLETVNSIPLAGKPVAFSFYARAGANYSGGALTNQVRTGTGTDQNLLTAGYTGGAFPSGLNNNATLTTTWQRFSYTGTTAATTKEIGIEFNFTPTGTAGADDWVEITGVQLEVGSVPTQFSRAGGTLAGELAACQRYYFRVVSGAVYTPLTAGGFSNSATSALGFTPFPVEMRIAPTALEQSGTANQYGINESGGGFTCSAVPVFNSATKVGAGTTFTFASGLTVGRGAWGRSDNNTTAYLAWSAEL